MTPTPTAAEIIARVSTLYASCASYRDEGDQVEGLRSPEMREAGLRVTRPFRTAFVRRPRAFFYEYGEVWGAYRVASGGVLASNHRTRAWRTIKPRSFDPSTLWDALSAFTLASGGTSSAVPGLLLFELTPRPALPNPQSARITGEGEHDGHLCYILEGSRRERVWIDRASMMLRRKDEHVGFDADLHAKSLQELREFRDALPPNESRVEIDIRIKDLEGNASPGFEGVTTTTWRPEMDIDIDPAVFEFTPPEGAA